MTTTEPGTIAKQDIYAQTQSPTSTDQTHLLPIHRWLMLS